MMDTELRDFAYLFFSSAFFVLFRDGGQTCRPAPNAAAAKEVTLRRVWEALNAVVWARKVLRRLWTKYPQKTKLVAKTCHGGWTRRPAPNAAAAKEVTLRRVWEALNGL